MLTTQNFRMFTTVQKMVANGGNSGSLAQAMRDAGYSENYARNPQKIKKTRAWTDLVQDSLSNDLIIQKHQEMLNSYRFHSIKVSIEAYDNSCISMFREIGWYIVSEIRDGEFIRLTCAIPDTRAITRAIDLAYKIKGRYKQIDNQSEDRKYENLSDKELSELLSKYKC